MDETADLAPETMNRVMAEFKGATAPEVAAGQKIAQELADGAWKAVTASAADMPPWQAHFYLVAVHHKLAVEIQRYESMSQNEYKLPCTPRDVLTSLLLLCPPDEPAGATTLEWGDNQIEAVEQAAALLSEDDRRAMCNWAMSIHFRASDNDDVEILPMPPMAKKFYPRFITSPAYNGEVKRT